MEKNNSSNKTIAINTIVLYIKLILSILIGLFTSRQVLFALGVTDYGIYSVVGGLVVMMNVLGTTMISTSNRFIAVEIGKNINGSLNKVYNTLFIIHVLLALLLLIVGETIGVYYVDNYLNIAPHKVSDALFVLHVSMITTAINVISMPAQGLIIAREKFVYTAILEIINQIIKLVFIFWLIEYTGNRLKAYAIIMAIYSLILSLGYNAYCWRKECEIITWKLNKNWSDYKEIFLFSWWMLIGALACVGRIQGSAIIINAFFGIVLNAAFGIATQVNEYATMFVRNLTQATNPQIMKSGGGGDNLRSIQLVYAISKYSFLIMLLPVIPLIYNIDAILVLWLKEPPVMTNLFVIFLLINGLVTCLNSGFDASIQTTGKVKINQIVYGIINLSLFPLMWICFSLEMPPYICTVIMIILSVITILFQCVIMKKLTCFSYKAYFEKTILPALYTTISLSLPLSIIHYFVGDGIIINIMFMFMCFIWTLVSIYLFGLDLSEKKYIITTINNKLLK